MRCAKKKCDVHFAENWVTGDLKHYDIHFENKNGIGADLKIDSLSAPWRPGSVYYDFGDGKYYTWLCAVPKAKLGKVLGKIATPFITGMMKKNFAEKEIRPSHANYSATGHFVLTDINEIRL